MADLISQIKGLDNVTYDLQDKVSTFGTENLLPYTQSKPYISNQTVAGITVSYDKDGWFNVTGTPTSGRTGGSFVPLWRSSAGNYTIPVNNLVPQEGEESLVFKVETEGTPFASGTAYTNSTHIVFYGTSSSTSVRLGGFKDTEIVSVFPQFISRVEYYVGKDANTTNLLEGRFRIKLERGNKSTDWTPSCYDLAIYDDETIEFFQ